MKILISYEEHTFSNPHLSKHPVQCAISDCQMTENSKRSRGQLHESTFSLHWTKLTSVENYLPIHSGHLEKKWNQFSDVTRWFLIDMTFWFDLLIVQFYTSFHISPFSQRSWRIILDLDSDFLSCYWNIGNFVINNFGVTVCDHCTVGCFVY